MPGLRESPWIIHYDASSCNGCDIEVLACLTPLYDVERLGVVNTGNPKHADIFLVTGAVNAQSKEVIRNIYRQLPEPKVVIAVGICAATGGIFRDCYNISGGIDHVIPVDLYVPGCAARPESIIDGVVQALGILEMKRRAMDDLANNTDHVRYLPATSSDAPEILALQKTAYESEAGFDQDENLPALRQTLEELLKEFEGTPSWPVSAGNGHDQEKTGSLLLPSIFLKAVLGGKIIGSVRGHAAGDALRINHLVVHPYFWSRGIGQRLLHEIEGTSPQVKWFETVVDLRSERNLRHFRRQGYEEFKIETLSPAIRWAHLRKGRL